MKRIFLLLTIFYLLLAGSCNLFPGDPELPPITMEGRNTFGCLINGKLFLPEAPIGYGAGVNVVIQTYPDTIGVSIRAGNFSTEQNLQMFVYGVPTIEIGRQYELTDDPIFSIRYIDSKSCDFRTIIGGNIKFLKFEVPKNSDKIVAGTFEFEAYSNECKDTIRVTNGRFDVSDVTHQ